MALTGLVEPIQVLHRRSRALKDAKLDKCPLQDKSGHGFVNHGTYPRQTPKAALRYPTKYHIINRIAHLIGAGITCGEITRSS